MNEETESPRETLIRALIDFRIHMRNTALGFLGYALISLGLGMFFLSCKDALLFGAGAPFLLTGLLLLWPAFRMHSLGQSVNAILNAQDTDTALVRDHEKRVMSEITILLHLRTSSTIGLSIGILLLIPACIFHWNDAISSLSIALAVQGGLISVAVMMTIFWLEIYLNEIQRHLR